jgi:hypothetical protein
MVAVFQNHLHRTLGLMLIDGLAERQPDASTKIMAWLRSVPAFDEDGQQVVFEYANLNADQLPTLQRLFTFFGVVIDPHLAKYGFKVTFRELFDKYQQLDENATEHLSSKQVLQSLGLDLDELEGE